MHPATDPVAGRGIATDLRFRRLGRRSFADACALQEQVAARVARGAADELLYVEHPPVVTLGRGFDAGQLVDPPEELARAGIAVYETDRGGGATYHGPGQLVGYPIIDLRRRGLSVRRYLRALERGLVGALREAGVDAGARPGLTGVWTTHGKIAAIGIAVRRGVTRHGFAVNVAPDLTAFGRIVPCGLALPVTSLAELGGSEDVGALQTRIADALLTELVAAAAAPDLHAGVSGAVAGGVHAGVPVVAAGGPTETREAPV